MANEMTYLVINGADAESVNDYENCAQKNQTFCTTNLAEDKFIVSYIDTPAWVATITPVATLTYDECITYIIDTAGWLDVDVVAVGEEDEGEGEGETTTGEVLETLDPIPNAIDATTFVIDGEEFITVTTTMIDSFSDSWNGDVQAKFTNIITGEVYYIAIGPEFDIEVVSVQLPQGTYGIYMGGSNYAYSSENSMTVMFGEETLLEIPQGTFPAVPGLYYGQTSEEG
jgi:hypothetical protein